MSFSAVMDQVSWDIAEKAECYTCGETFPADSLTECCEHAFIKICPRCVFLSGLYLKNKIRTQFSKGCFKMNRINTKFRNIVLKEFSVDPQSAYRKYLGDLLAVEEAKANPKFQVPVNFDEFEFVFLPDDSEAVPDPGTVTKIVWNGEAVFRNILQVKHLSAKRAKQYGFNGAGKAFYVPAINETN